MQLKSNRNPKISPLLFSGIIVLMISFMFRGDDALLSMMLFVFLGLGQISWAISNFFPEKARLVFLLKFLSIFCLCVAFMFLLLLWF